MKRKLLLGKAVCVVFVCMLCLAGTSSFAQAQMATLQHGENFSAFYGINAFIEAHEAAVDSDIITLSSGEFNATNITKAITLHGAGVKAETAAQCLPTQIKIGTNDHLNIDIQNENIPLVIEGIDFCKTLTTINIASLLHHASFIKCNFYSIDAEAGLKDVEFINCWVPGDFKVKSIDNNLKIINSVIGRSTTYSNSTNIIAYNSILGFYFNSNCYLYNCILTHRSGTTGGFNSSYFYNCIGVGYSVATQANAYNCLDASVSEVFKTYTGGTIYTYTDLSLTDEIIASFHGTDGTQVGIYGGAMPYCTRPSYLILNNTVVSGQSDSNGNLNIDIEIINDNK